MDQVRGFGYSDTTGQYFLITRQGSRLASQDGLVRLQGFAGLRSGTHPGCTFYHSYGCLRIQLQLACGIEYCLALARVSDSPGLRAWIWRINQRLCTV